MSPADLFKSADSPMDATRLWITWVGMALFIALIFSSFRDLARRHSRLGRLSIALGALVVVALVLVLLLPRG